MAEERQRQEGDPPDGPADPKPPEEEGRDVGVTTLPGGLQPAVDPTTGEPTGDMVDLEEVEDPPPPQTELSSEPSSDTEDPLLWGMADPATREDLPGPSAADFFDFDGQTTLKGLGAHPQLRFGTPAHGVALLSTGKSGEVEEVHTLVSPAGGVPLPSRPSSTPPPPSRSTPPSGSRFTIPPPASPRSSLHPPVLASAPAPKESEPNSEAITVEGRPSSVPPPALYPLARRSEEGSLPPAALLPAPARDPGPNRAAEVTAGGLPPAMPPVKKVDQRLIKTLEEPKVVVAAEAQPGAVAAEVPVQRFPPPSKQPTTLPPPKSVPPPAAGPSGRMSGPPSRPPRSPNRYVAMAIIVGLVLCIAIVVIGMQTRAAIQGDDVSGPARVIANVIRRFQRHTPTTPTPIPAPVRRAPPPVVMQRPAPRLRPAPAPRVAPAPEPPTVGTPEPSAAPQCRTLGSFSANVARAQPQAVQAGYRVMYLFPGESAAAHTIVCRRE